MQASLDRFFNLFIIGNHVIFSFMMLLLSDDECRRYNSMSGYVQNNMPNYFCVDFGAPNGSLFFTNLIFDRIKNESAYDPARLFSIAKFVV